VSAFQIERGDNVATALDDCAPGAVDIAGDAAAPEIAALEAIPRGHKLAVRDIAAGEAIVKYGVSIGGATRDIPAGAWVHVHCMKSNCDEKSGDIDPRTGVSTATRYE
jgi:altronate dehydratase